MTLRTPPSDFTPSLLQPLAASGALNPRPMARPRSLRLGKALPYGWTFGPLLLILGWSAGAAAGWIDPRNLPAPWTVISTAIALSQEGRLQENLLVSLQRVSEGFTLGVLAGVLVGMFAGLSRIGEYLVDGVIQIKRAIPTLALIPLLMLYLGIGEGMKIAIIALTVFIPVYINLHAYLRAIDSRYIELADTLRLRYRDFVRHIVLPGALPGLLLGLRFGVTGAWLALVVVEQINATSGIGYMINLAGSYGQINVVLVGLAVYAAMGFVSDATIRFIQKKALTWQRTFAN